MRHFIRLSNEVQSAARYLAQRGFTGATGEPLPLNMSYEAVEEIARNLIAFRLCVHLHRAFEFYN